MKNNMKELNMNEMEQVNGGYLDNDLAALRQQLTRRRIRLIDNIDLLIDDDCFRRRPENPDRINPDLLRRLIEQLRETDRPQ